MFRPGRGRSSWLTPGFTRSTENRDSTLLTFLHAPGLAEELSTAISKGDLFSQGDSADSVFYIQSGRLKVTVVSANGKEATITLLFRWRLYWGEFACRTGWTPISYGHCNHAVLCDEDYSK
jgi:hypothetical protein